MSDVHYLKQQPFSWLRPLNHAFQAGADLLNHPKPFDALKVVGPKLTGPVACPDFSDRDNKFLLLGMQILALLKFPVSESFKGKFNALDDKEQSVDFLDIEKRPSDKSPVIFVNYIVQTIETENHEINPDHLTQVSPLHNIPEIWRKAAEYDGAEVIVIFGAGTEVNANDFAGGRYEPFLTENDLPQSYGDQLPTGLTILIDRQALAKRNIAPHKNFSKEPGTSSTNDLCLKSA